MRLPVAAPAMTIYMDHLHHETFAQPVLFRIRGATENAMMPVYDIGLMLRERYGLVERRTLDVAQTIDAPIAEFAFDAAAVEDPEAVLDDVKELLDNYNEIPDGFTEEQEEKYRKHHTTLADTNWAGSSLI